MITFYFKVLKEIISKLDLQKTFFIIPNKRSKALLKNNIIDLINKPTIAPIILSIDDFTEQVSGLKESSRTNQIFDLFESYLKISDQNDIQSYSKFRSWANTLINDTNDIEMSLSSTDEVFNYLYELQKLNMINDDEKNIGLWKLLPKVIKRFKSLQLEAGSVNKGQIHLLAKENISDFSNAHSDYSFIFVGLNSLSKSEEYIINYLLENNRVKVFWDYDHEYLNNPLHQAGHFFRKYKKTWPHYTDNSFLLGEDFSKERKDFLVYETAKNVAQVKTVNRILRDIYSGKNNSKTAVILPRSELLIPMLNSIPSVVDDINVSMTIPLLDLPFSELSLRILNMYVNLRKKGFFYKDVQNVLSDPKLITVMDAKSSSIKDFLDSITEKNLIYVSIDKFKNEFKGSKIIDLVFRSTKENIFKNIETLFETIKNKENNSLAIDQFNSIKQVLLIIKNFLQKQKFKMEYKDLRDFYIDMLKNQSLSLVGDINSKVQIMGLLESRGIDFDNVIICSVNEGVLPKDNFNSTFLPFDVRKKFDLPTIEDADARTAYDFYRLTHRSKKVHLIYNSNPDGLDSGEKSRYIYQLEFQKKSNYKISNISSYFPLNFEKTKQEEHIKSPEAVKRLNEISKKGFTPSALKDYVEDKIRFYDKYILQIKDSESVIERAEHRGVGNIFHNTMEALYKDQEKKTLTIKSLNQILNKAEETLTQKFIEEYGKDYNYGKNIIAFQTILKNVKELINNDISKVEKGVKIKVLIIEELLTVNLKTTNSEIKFALKGKMDRVQEEDGVLHVLDYKTGNVEPNKLTFTDNEDIIQNKKTNIIQLACYNLIVSSILNSNKPFKSGIISFKHINQGTLWMKEKISFKERKDVFNEEDLKNFENLVYEIVEDIHDVNSTFKNE
ncbi:MAG: PD-(D/E)XK nuclease family protein [Bacteroidota bacterium]